MRSSDWSSDVSSSDLTEFHAVGVMIATDAIYLNSSYGYGNKSRTYEIDAEGPLVSLPGGDARLAVGAGYRYNDFLYLYLGSPTADGNEGSRFAYAELNRSEEHTSELQSLMRISYAVFCLKKKNKNKHKRNREMK